MDEVQAPARRPGLWGWILLSATALGVVAVGVAIWMRTSSDLDALRRQAVAAGLPATWRDLDVAAGRSPHAGALAQAEELCSRRSGEVDAGRAANCPFAPVPNTLSCWRLAGGSGIEDAVDALVDQVRPGEVLHLDVAAIEAAIARRDAEALVGERALLFGGRGFWSLLIHYRLRIAAGVDDQQALADRLLRLAGSLDAPSTTQLRSCLYAATAWGLAVQRHRLPTAAAADAARRLAERFDALLPRVVAAQPLIYDAMLRLPPERMFRACNLRVPEVMTYPFTMDPLHRLGRGPIVASRVRAAIWVAGHGVPRSHDDILAASPAFAVGVLDMPTRLLGSMFDHPWCQRCSGYTDDLHGLLSFHLRVTTQLRLLAADLVGEPWPADPCDRAGGRLRPITRDGAMIGAYSLGANAIDDGADIRGDWCWPLRAQLGYPRASDQPMPP